MDAVDRVSGRDAAGRFVPGLSGNPAGKRPGTRNRKTILAESLLDGEDRGIARIVIDKARSPAISVPRNSASGCCRRSRAGGRSRSICRRMPRPATSSHSSTPFSPRWRPATSPPTRR